jgi:hypothetical protein
MNNKSLKPIKRIRVSIFYNYLLVGTEADVVKIWQDPSGCKWYTLFLGYNASGKKMVGSITADCTEDI